MFGPFRTAGKVDPPPAKASTVTYPRLLVEHGTHRIVETKQGHFLIEEKRVGHDSLGAPINYWIEEASFKDDETGYQSPIPPRTIVWALKLLVDRTH